MAFQSQSFHTDDKTGHALPGAAATPRKLGKSSKTR
jgi:uncharacterized protein YukJ